MNPNSPPEPDAPAPGNPYSARLQQTEHPDLDAGAPELRTAELRRMNRRALAFLVTIVVLLVAAALWMFNSAMNGKDSRPKPREERISIPEAPKPPAMPPPRPAEAIAVAPALPILPAQLPPPLPLAPTGPHQPTLVERRMQSAQSAAAVGVDQGGNGAPMASAQYPGAAPGGGPFGAAGAEPAVPPNSAYTMKPLAATSTAQPLLRPDTLMLRGTYIRCVLETHIVTDIPGFTSCVVTEPVYSFSGKRLLLPKGSKVLGRYSMEPNGPRVAVIWDRIVTPTGIDVSMASPGVDNLGGAGHPGFLDEHWGSRIGSAMLISLFSDAFKYAAAEYGPSSSTVSSSGVVVQSPFESNTARTLQDLANQAVRRSANRPATVTIHQGTVLNVYVAKDVDFSGVVARY